MGTIVKVLKQTRGNSGREIVEKGQEQASKGNRPRILGQGSGELLSVEQV